MLCRYRIVAPFAEGAQARLYRAHDKVTSQSCILKTGEFVDQEALLALELNHPFIARPFDFGVEEPFGKFSAFPEFSEPSFLDWIASNPSENDLRRVGLQLAEFLCFIHDRGWLYNDFKPEHFLVGLDEIKVIDLGLCTRLDGVESASTYSGTFPYVSPERLAGRAADARSDIFAAGMMLLHAFYPEEEWNCEPSLSTLQNLQSRCKKLKGFWKEVITDMTALEPGQRIGSPKELWKKLRPDSHAKVFLFFPYPSHFSIQEQMQESDSVYSVRSTSPAILEEAERQAVSLAWKSHIRTIHFDLRRTPVQTCFEILCNLLTGEEGAPHFYLALERLQSIKNQTPLLVLLQGFDIASNEKSLLQLALSTLSNVPLLRFFVMTADRGDHFEQERWKEIDLPLIHKDAVGTVLEKMFPGGGQPDPRITRTLKKTHSTPEQLLWELKRQLPESSREFWPAAARLASGIRSIDGLNVAEKKMLFTLALCGGTISRSLLLAAVKRNEKVNLSVLAALRDEGFIHEEGERIYLTLPLGSILSRLRRIQIKAMAARILEAWGEQIHSNPEAVYHVARNARNKRLAVLSALRLAKAARKQNRGEEFQLWLLNAFSTGAALPRRLLFQMATYQMRRAKMKSAAKIITHMRERFGFSFRLIDLMLDYFHRRNQLRLGTQRAEWASRLAGQRNKPDLQHYFQARKAGFLIWQNEFGEAEQLLELLLSRNLIPSTRGLVHHFSGLCYYYRGRISEAIPELKKSFRSRHHFRSTSYMSLAVCYLKMSKLEEARKWLDRAVSVFARLQDVERLSVAYNNIGICFKQTGQLAKARHYYYRSLHLTSVCKNVNHFTGHLINLAISYELEGRTDRAIYYHKKVMRTARKAGLKFYLAASLTNLGLQYAILGRFSLAIESLQTAARIKKELGAKMNLAGTYEYLGLTYYLSQHPGKALRYLRMASDLFRETSGSIEQGRTELYRALCYLQLEEMLRAGEIVKKSFAFTDNSFESGLYSYVVAALQLASKEWDQGICRNALHDAERIFRKHPALFWLAKLYNLKIEYFQRSERYEKALLSLQIAFNLFSRLRARKELLNLEPLGRMMSMPTDFLDRMAEKLPYKILLMLKQVLAMRDPESMISAILSASLEFTDMDRAVLILQEDPPRIFKSAAIDDLAVQEIYEISRSTLESVADSGKPFVCFDASEHPYIKAKPSIVGNHIMSIVCLPLKTEDRIIGMLYLDSKEGIESLTKTENLLLELFASIIALALNRALELERSLEENEQLRTSVEWYKLFPEIIGKSRAITNILQTVHRLLDNELPVLIYGETGTGKELIARVLHYCGKRKNGPFIAINCSAFTKDLMETELFGHEKGAFTGATGLKRGLFEEAHSGTIFLDEISEMPFSMQAKILRVLQGGEFRRVGGTQTLHSNARVVLATNRDLRQMVEEKAFREDLYYRIRGVQIHVPALRERREDIPLLANEFLKEALLTVHKKIQGFTPEAFHLIKHYRWPGNVRQLKLEIERIVALTENQWISTADLDPQITESVAHSAGSSEGTGSLQEIERQIILERLKQYQGSVIQAAKSLGLSRHGLYSKMKRYQISADAES